MTDASTNKTQLETFLLRSYVEQLTGRKALNINTTAPLRSAPFDPRFVVQDQSKVCSLSWVFVAHLALAQYCWTAFNEFLRCVKVKGPEEKVCRRLKQTAEIVCPNKWVRALRVARVPNWRCLHLQIGGWREARKAGTFAGVAVDWDEPEEARSMREFLPSP